MPRGFGPVAAGFHRTPAAAAVAAGIHEKIAAAAIVRTLADARQVV